MPRDLIRFMQSLFLPSARSLQEGCWYPCADVYRTPTGWLVKLDLAGIRPEEVEVAVAGHRLIVRGVRRDRSVKEERHCYRMEIAYNRFERVIEMPAELDRSSIATEYRDGMLTVRIRPEARKHGNSH